MLYTRGADTGRTMSEALQLRMGLAIVAGMVPGRKDARAPWNIGERSVSFFWALFTWKAR